ncbi:MAG: GspE/PulE family protein [Planctomycetes bacterium]|nr:GspE/PulE family protein [Planctomycetota bacterium]
MSGGRKLLGRILRERGVVKEGQIQEALEVQRKEGRPIGAILVSLGHCTEKDVAAALAIQSGMEVVDAAALAPSPELLARIDPSTASVFGILPVKEDRNELVVAVLDPRNGAVLDDLRFLVGKPVRAVLAEEKALKAAVERAYGGKGGKSVADAVAAAGGGEKISGDAQALAHAAPVVRLLNAILHQAIRDRASDVHLEPFDGEFRIRYRVDGVLYPIESPPPHLAPALTSRVKVLANLDIAESRLPQDGRIELSIDGRSVDLRVSTLPTMFGESCVMRVLDRGAVRLELAGLGLRADEEAAVRALLDLPHGIVLVTGPTGSGKTTTLYGMLAAANDPTLKIITTEDPVEYDLPGIVQIPIQEDIGVSYAAVLRTILRQDPDVILVGEIRDRETAQVSIEASLTGHLVFSTLHTNDAPAAVTRMVDIGVEPFLLGATLEAVVAQRLVRRICTSCRTPLEPDPRLLRDLGLPAEVLAGAKFAYGKGCDACFHTGFRGRTAIFEILRMSDRVRNLVLEGASHDRLLEAARADGMRPLRDSGLLLVAEGETTIEEILRETTAID